MNALTMRCVSFQFSSSLIATEELEEAINDVIPLSILLESYCNSYYRYRI